MTKRIQRVGELSVSTKSCNTHRLPPHPKWKPTRDAHWSIATHFLTRMLFSFIWDWRLIVAHSPQLKLRIWVCSYETSTCRTTLASWRSHGIAPRMILRSVTPRLTYGPPFRNFTIGGLCACRPRAVPGDRPGAPPHAARSATEPRHQDSECATFNPRCRANGEKSRSECSSVKPSSIQRVAISVSMVLRMVIPLVRSKR